MRKTVIIVRGVYAKGNKESLSLRVLRVWALNPLWGATEEMEDRTSLVKGLRSRALEIDTMYIHNN